MHFFTFLFHPFQSPVGSGACVNPWAGDGAVKASGTEQPRTPGETALHTPQPHTGARAAGLRAQAPRVISSLPL